MTALTIAECKRTIMWGKKQLTAAEERIVELEAQHCPYVRWLDGESYCDCSDYIEKLKALVRDMDYCLLNHMSCDQCEIRPCRLGERVKELGLRGRGGAR